jgi:hypothetical protein
VVIQNINSLIDIYLVFCSNNKPRFILCLSVCSDNQPDNSSAPWQEMAGFGIHLRAENNVKSMVFKWVF